MYEPYDRATASPADRVAWALCQIIDDDAPMRWTRYRFAADCIASNPEVMADLHAMTAHKAQEGWNIIPFTGSFKTSDERWEVYDPEGSGGAVNASDVRDPVVAKLLDALASRQAVQTNTSALLEEADSAVACSHNFATAKPDILPTEQEHILGLCRVVQKLRAALTPAATPRGDDMRAMADMLNPEKQADTLRAAADRLPAASEDNEGAFPPGWDEGRKYRCVRTGRQPPSEGELLEQLEIAARIHDDMTGKGNAIAATIRLAATTIRRLAASGQMGEWQPIETAPRDGTDVLVLLNVATVDVVHIAWWREPDPDLDEGPEDRGWWSYTRGSVTQEMLDGYRTPTHWMPLLATPTQQEGR